MSTIEQQAYDILSEKSYTLSIAGEDILFKQATLDQLGHIGAITSNLPMFDEVVKTEDDPNVDIPQIVDSLKYARLLGDILMVTVDTKFSYKDPLGWIKRRMKAKRVIYNKASTLDILIAVQEILKRNHLFFYQRTITFLKGMNHLKPTKGIDQTVRGQ